MQTLKEVERCLNCDVQTVLTDSLCIECDACVDICPVDCLTITRNGDEDDLRQRLKAPALNTDQDLFVSEPLKQTGRVMTSKPEETGKPAEEQINPTLKLALEIGRAAWDQASDLCVAVVVL